jgi:diguanylate cyclase (GGDEF)-like protein
MDRATTFMTKPKRLLYFIVGLSVASLMLLHLDLKIETILVRFMGIYGGIGIYAGLLISHPQPRRGWELVAVGTVISIIGDFFYTEMYYLNRPILSPTTGVFIYAMGMIIAFCGLGVILYSIRQQINRDSLIQGLIVATGFFSLIWLIQINPNLKQSGDVFNWVKDAGIPIGLVVVIAIWCIPLATPTGKTWSFRLTFAASLLFVLGAYLQSIGVSGWPTPFVHKGPSDLVYYSDMAFALAYLTMASAILHPSSRTFLTPAARPDPYARDDIYLLGLSFFLTPAAYLIQYLRHKPMDGVFVVASSCVIFMLVMLRLSAVFKTISLQNQQLNRQQQDLQFMAFHDKLTGLPNRGYLDNFLERAIKRPKPDQMGAVLMMDLNHFKSINDTFGHHVGDEVLCEIAQQLNEAKRYHDVVGRWGGDEFLFILEGLKDTQDALVFAQRLSSLISTTRMRGEIEYKVTLCIGICMFPLENHDAQTIIRFADQAMYRAKGNGQDNVAIHSESGSSLEPPQQPALGQEER